MSARSMRSLRDAIASVGQWLLIATGGLVLAGGLFGWLFAGTFGLNSALVAVVVVALLFGVTWGIDKLIMKNIHLATSLVFGSYVVKLLIVIICVFVARKTEMFEPIVMFAILVSGIIVASVIQAVFLGRVQVIDSMNNEKTKEDASKS